jgi:microsomal dipeptidase-like Zn-dependent dipeptidase
MLIDGLQCGHFTRESFEELRRGEVGCVTVTCGFWEGAVETMDLVGRWRAMARRDADLIRLVRTAAGIREAAADGRVAVLLGSQNAELLDGRIAFVELFAEMGIRVIQLTYNNQNALGGSCYETEDSGLARFGREVVREMNRAGILVDLSHVGNRTTLDAIRHSQQPVAITHANADRLFPHKRNKTDDVLHALRDNGGVIGCATYRNITGDEFCRSVEAWCGMVARTDYDWMRMGRWTRGTDGGAGPLNSEGRVPPADWFTEIHHIGRIPAGLKSVGFNNDEIAKLTHGNWLRLYAAVFGE